MSAECYQYNNSVFEQIENPLLDYRVDDNLDDELDRAGYSEELHLSGKFSNFPCLTVYKNTGDNPAMPIYMVDFRGNTKRLAWYSANDFHALQAVLKFLAPLTRYKRKRH